MNIRHLTVKATIPTGSYANLIPEITIELDNNEEYAAAKAEAMKHIATFSSQYAEDGKAISGSTATVKKLRKMSPFIGNVDLYFDKEAHVYTDEEGDVYESGSQFAHKYEHEFNVNLIAPIYAKKFNVSEQDVRNFWRSKADASTTFGTALHQALETHGKYAALAEKLNTEEKPVTTGINNTLQAAVELFFTPERMKEDAIYEPFVNDNNTRRCGQIDRLVIVDREKKICDIEDYKTNGDLYKQGQPKFLKAPFDKDGQGLLNQPISGYTIQLNFYRSILEANGWTVRNLTIHHWTENEWLVIPVNKIEEV